MPGGRQTGTTWQGADMELKNVTDDAIDSGMEVDIVDTEKFIFDKANDEKILLGLFFIALSLR